MISDNILMKYIDELFLIYDFNQSGNLDSQQLHLFFNDLFSRLGDQRRYNNYQLRIIFRQADLNNDGVIDKYQLLRVCKLIFKNKPYKGNITTYIQPSINFVYSAPRRVYSSYVTAPYRSCHANCTSVSTITYSPVNTISYQPVNTTFYL